MQNPRPRKILRAEGMDDEDILEDLSPCGLRSTNFENLDLPGWVGGGRIEAQRQLVEDF